MVCIVPRLYVLYLENPGLAEAVGGARSFFKDVLGVPYWSARNIP